MSDCHFGVSLVNYVKSYIVPVKIKWIDDLLVGRGGDVRSQADVCVENMRCILEDNIYNG